MRCAYTFEELDRLMMSLPKNIEFPIFCREGDDYVFSVQEGKVDQSVMALIHSLSLKLRAESSNLGPLTKKGIASDDCDLLFYAIGSVNYDDKNGSNYQLNFDESELTMLGKQMIASLRNENYWINVDVGTSAEDGYMFFGVIG